jgi:hypothetical protein
MFLFQCSVRRQEQLCIMSHASSFISLLVFFVIKIVLSMRHALKKDYYQIIMETLLIHVLFYVLRSHAVKTL